MTKKKKFFIVTLIVVALALFISGYVRLESRRYDPQTVQGKQTYIDLVKTSNTGYFYGYISMRKAVKADAQKAIDALNVTDIKSVLKSGGVDVILHP